MAISAIRSERFCMLLSRIRMVYPVCKREVVDELESSGQNEDNFLMLESVKLNLSEMFHAFEQSCSSSPTSSIVESKKQRQCQTAWSNWSPVISCLLLALCAQTGKRRSLCSPVEQSHTQPFELWRKLSWCQFWWSLTCCCSPRSSECHLLLLKHAAGSGLYISHGRNRYTCLLTDMSRSDSLNTLLYARFDHSEPRVFMNGNKKKSISTWRYFSRPHKVDRERNLARTLIFVGIGFNWLLMYMHTPVGESSHAYCKENFSLLLFAGRIGGKSSFFLLPLFLLVTRKLTAWCVYGSVFMLLDFVMKRPFTKATKSASYPAISSRPKIVGVFACHNAKKVSGELPARQTTACEITIDKKFEQETRRVCVCQNKKKSATRTANTTSDTGVTSSKQQQAQRKQNYNKKYTFSPAELSSERGEKEVLADSNQRKVPPWTKSHVSYCAACARRREKMAAGGTSSTTGWSLLQSVLVSAVDGCHCTHPSHPSTALLPIAPVYLSPTRFDVFKDVIVSIVHNMLPILGEQPWHLGYRPVYVGFPYDL